MTRPIAVLRPEPGNSATAAAIEGAGRRALRLPLFEVRALRWQAPDPPGFDALLLTSANTLRHGGAGLAALRALPVYAVGPVTAEAARRDGFAVAAVGGEGAAALLALAQAAGVRRALHLGGQERHIETGGIVAASLAVYQSAPRAVADEALAALPGSVALVQSARAGAQLAMLAERAGLDRSAIALAAVSDAAAAAVGTGWAATRVARDTDPGTLLDLAFALAD